MNLKILIILLLVMSNVSAQQIAQPLRLADCIAQALGQNPSLQMSQAKVQAAEARTSEATTGLLPQLRLTGRAAKVSAVDPFGINIQSFYFNYTAVLFPSITENYSMRLSLQQPLFTGFKLLKNR